MVKFPPRRNSLQEEQRRTTREAICRAALEVFADTGYAGSSIEPILTKADVSRATFYSHFDGKLAVVCAIAEDFKPDWFLVFQNLTSIVDFDFSTVAEWVKKFIDFHRSNFSTCSLLTQTAAIEERLYLLISRQRDELIEMLGQRLPSFAAAKDSETVLLEARALLWQIDQICFRAVREESCGHIDAVSNVIVGQMLYFLRHRPVNTMGFGS